MLKDWVSTTAAISPFSGLTSDQSVPNSHLSLSKLLNPTLTPLSFTICSNSLFLAIPSPSLALILGFKACKTARWDDFQAGMPFRQLRRMVRAKNMRVMRMLRMGTTSQDQVTWKYISILWDVPLWRWGTVLVVRRLCMGRLLG